MKKISFLGVVTLCVFAFSLACFVTAALLYDTFEPLWLLSTVTSAGYLVFSKEVIPSKKFYRHLGCHASWWLVGYAAVVAAALIVLEAVILIKYLGGHMATDRIVESCIIWVSCVFFWFKASRSLSIKAFLQREYRGWLKQVENIEYAIWGQYFAVSVPRGTPMFADGDLVFVARLGVEEAIDIVTEQADKLTYYQRFRPAALPIYTAAVVEGAKNHRRPKRRKPSPDQNAPEYSM